MKHHEPSIQNIRPTPDDRWLESKARICSDLATDWERLTRELRRLRRKVADLELKLEQEKARCDRLSAQADRGQRHLIAYREAFGPLFLSGR